MLIFTAPPFLENDVHPSDVCLLRHSLFVMNIMQISGYFKVDQVRWEQEGIASEFDGEFCKKMISRVMFPHKLCFSKPTVRVGSVRFWFDPGRFHQFGSSIPVHRFGSKFLKLF